MNTENEQSLKEFEGFVDTQFTDLRASLLPTTRAYVEQCMTELQATLKEAFKDALERYEKALLSNDDLVKGLPEHSAGFLRESADTSARATLDSTTQALRTQVTNYVKNVKSQQR